MKEEILIKLRTTEEETSQRIAAAREKAAQTLKNARAEATQILAAAEADAKRHEQERLAHEREQLEFERARILEKGKKEEAALRAAYAKRVEQFVEKAAHSFEGSLE